MKTKRGDSEISIWIDDADDLWYLKNILTVGDLVTMRVMRRPEKREDALRSKEEKRVPVTVTVRVESIEFQEFSSRLKLLGIITEGPENIVGEHQSLIISSGDDLKIQKDSWSKIQLSLLREAENRSLKNRGIFVALDDENAEIMVMRSYGIQVLATIRSGRSGKLYESRNTEKDYFNEIADSLSKISGDIQLITIIGPGFTREKLLDFLKADVRFTDKIIKSYPANRADEVAVYEYLHSEDGMKSFAEARLSRENELLSKFMAELSRDGMYAYGFDDVMNALRMGAVDTVIIAESKLPAEETDQISREAKNISARVYIFSSSSEPGKIVEEFGGYCAILRYKIAR